MKTLIKHLLRNNSEEILAKSFFNCHCIGLHSIMLLESPGKTIRLYIAAEGNHLHLNLEKNQPLAFHPHHCDLTFEVIKGTLFNWIIKPEDSELALSDELLFGIKSKYYYKSHITTGTTEFMLCKGNDPVVTKSFTKLNVGDTVFMDATDIHTVVTRKDELTAWLVYEGKEDKDYIPYCWSNNPLMNEVNVELYQRFKTIEHIKHYLNLVL